MTTILESMGWPHFAFLFALVFIFVFYRPIAELIRRITKINKEGLSTEPTPEGQREKERKETSSEAVQELLDALGNSLVISEQQNNIKKDMESKSLSVEGDSVKVLIKNLAVTQVLLVFEKVHGTIFGSQIFLLKKLNEVVGQGRPLNFVTSHLDSVKKAYPDQFGDWSLQQYLEFLFSQRLIVQHGNQFHITELGVEYLTWIIRVGRGDNKPW